MPDARLLPAHGPVTGSVHERVNELLAHHDLRLAETRRAVLAGHASPYQVATALKWTRQQRPFGDLDLFSQIMAVNETAAHLEVLAARGQVTQLGLGRGNRPVPGRVGRLEAHPLRAGVDVHRAAAQEPDQGQAALLGQRDGQ